MRVTNLVLAFVIFAAPGAAFAEVHEFTGCTFKEGHGMADLEKWLPRWKADIDKLKIKDQLSAEIVTPQYDTENKLDFFFMVTVPDANVLGSGLNQWIEGGTGSASDAELNKFAKCSASLWWGRKVYGK
jgi:hypothetical protein